jgi:hypothetical protein
MYLHALFGLTVSEFRTPATGSSSWHKEQYQRKFLLAISILLDNQTMKILSFPSRTF